MSVQEAVCNEAGCSFPALGMWSKPWGLTDGLARPPSLSASTFLLLAPFGADLSSQSPSWLAWGLVTVSRPHSCGLNPALK